MIVFNISLISVCMLLLCNSLYKIIIDHNRKNYEFLISFLYIVIILINVVDLAGRVEDNMMIFNIVMIVLFTVFMCISGYRVLTNHMDKNIEFVLFILSFTCLVSNVFDLVRLLGLK